MNAGQTTAAPEQLLRDYDLVFAKARAALEAMAVGCAVIVCDTRGAGPLVTPENFNQLRPWNFGFCTLTEAPTTEYFTTQILRYDARAATDVCRLVRAQAALEPVVDELVRAYESACAAQKQNPPSAAEESRAVAAYLQWLMPTLKQAHPPALAWSRRKLCERLARKADKLSRWLRAR